MTTGPWETERRAELRTGFDEDPEADARSRPIPPPPVVDELVARAALRPGASVVEVGPGTGQLTRPLAEHGLRVLAVEIGPRLAALARSELADLPDVTVVTSSFEAWAPGGERCDAVVACNSFHWLDPDRRWAKAADILGPGGYAAILSTPWVVPEEADRFWWDVQDDWAAVGADRVDPGTEHPDLVGDVRDEVRDSGLFGEPVARRRPFEVTFTAASLATNPSTQSAARALGPAAGAELLDRVRRRIEWGGGTVTAHLLAVLVVGPSARPGGLSVPVWGL